MAETSHLRRVASEQILQALSIAVALFDRLFLTALLYRVWGTADFEAWSIVVAISGLAALCECGFNMYFANRLMIEVENGRHGDARRTLAIGNAIFALCAASSLLLALALISARGEQVGDLSKSQSILTVILLALPVSLRLAMVCVHGLYRAHRQFARLSKIIVTGEVLRIALSCGAIGLGGGIIAVATVGAVSVILTQVVFAAFDASRRFAFDIGSLELPTRKEIKEILPPSMAYFAQMIPLIGLTHVPVLFVGSATAVAGALAGFVLLRSIGGLPRALLQSLGAILGQECARRIAIGDSHGAYTVLDAGTRGFSVMSGLASGVLIAGGPLVVSAWTADSGIFRVDYMATALLPMLVAAASVISHNLLSASNTPYLAATGRLAQLALTIVIVGLAPISDAGLRMLAGLSAGEILGFTPLSYLAVARLIPEANALYHLRMIGLTLASAAAAFVLTSFCLAGAGAVPGPGTIARLGLAVIICAALFPLLGLTVENRRRLITQWLLPVWRRLSGASSHRQAPSARDRE